MKDFFVNSFFSLEEYRYADLWEDCVYVWDALSRLEEFLRTVPLGKIEIEIPSGVHLVHPDLISIGEGTRVEPGAYIQGPCVIGERCQVRSGAYVRGQVITGDGCVLGHDSEFKHSILLNGVHAAHFNYVGDCILGNAVNLGAGVKCANVRLDKELVQIAFNGKKIPTGLKKMGAILGDGVQIGCNAVTSPGTVMGKNVLCHPCLHVQGVIPSHAKVKASQPNTIEE
jgi:NDP-sugar pyrophosphorylase family protein